MFACLLLGTAMLLPLLALAQLPALEGLFSKEALRRNEPYLLACLFTGLALILISFFLMALAASRAYTLGIYDAGQRLALTYTRAVPADAQIPAQPAAGGHSVKTRDCLRGTLNGVEIAACAAWTRHRTGRTLTLIVRAIDARLPRAQTIELQTRTVRGFAKKNATLRQQFDFEYEAKTTPTLDLADKLGEPLMQRLLDQEATFTLREGELLLRRPLTSAAMNVRTATCTTMAQLVETAAELARVLAT
jgi:hypothetical protein